MCSKLIVNETVVLLLLFAAFYQTNAQNVITNQTTTEKTTGASNATTVLPTTTSTSVSTVTPKPTCKPTEANVFVDNFLEKVRSQMPSVTPLPNMQEFLFQLTDGSIRNLNTLKRTEDASLECGKDKAQLTIPFTTGDALSTQYAWRHMIMPFSSGRSTSQVKSLKGKALVSYKMSNGEATVESLDITDLGQMDVQVELGPSIFPDIFSTMTSKVTTFMLSHLKPFIKKKISNVLKDALNQALIGVKL